LRYEHKYFLTNHHTLGLCFCNIQKTFVEQHGNSNCFEVKVGMHQGSALSPLLLVIVMEAISKEFTVPYHGSCCMLMTWL